MFVYQERRDERYIYYMQKACLLIHGFGGSVREVTPLAEALVADGYAVLCAELKGHTDRAKDMKSAGWQDWIQSAEGALDQLKEKYKEVFVIGFSMGGLIGMRLAMRYEIRALITINTPIYYWNLRRILYNIASDIKSRSFVNIRRYTSSSGSLPMRAVFNFLSLLYKTRPLIPQVQCPVFTLQALDDDTVQSRSAAYIQRKIASKNKQVKYYPKGGHVILLSQEAPEVITNVKEYLAAFDNGHLY